jgi:hypothetical protein
MPYAPGLHHPSCDTIALLADRGESLLEMAYRLEREGAPAALLGGIVWLSAIESSKQATAPAPTVFAAIVDNTTGTNPAAARLSRPAIQELSRTQAERIERQVSTILHMPPEQLIVEAPKHRVVVETPAGAVNTARFLLALGHDLLRLHVSPSIRFDHPRSSTPGSATNDDAVAGLGVQIQALAATLQGHITVAGVPIALPLTITRSERRESFAWPAVASALEGLRCIRSVPPDIVDWLFPDRTVDIQSLAQLLERTTEDRSRTEEMFATLEAVTGGLIADARTNGRYAPQGRFILRLPPELPLAQMGIASLRLVVTHWGMAAGLATANGRTARVLTWNPRVHAAALGTKEWHHRPGVAILPYIYCTLAAVWRDLRVEGGRAFPAQPRESPRGNGPHPPPDPVHRLPRTSRTGQEEDMPAGRRQWATPEEREHIIRRMHEVCSFIRRLPPGQRASDEARNRANQADLILPDGHTFVRGHTRYRGAEQAPIPQIIARGLATLIAFARPPAELAGAEDDDEKDSLADRPAGGL